MEKRHVEQDSVLPPPRWRQGFGLGMYYRDDMPVAFDFLPHLDLLYMAGYGLVTGKDYIRANRAAACDPRRRPGQRTILDVRGVTALSVLPQEFYEIIRMDRELNAAGVYGQYRTAFLMRPGGVEETLAGLYNALVREEGMGIRPFFMMEEVLRWLELADAAGEVEMLGRTLRKQATSPASPQTR